MGKVIPKSWYMPWEAIVTCFAIAFFGWIYIPQIVGMAISGKTFVLATIITTVVFIVICQQIMDISYRQENRF